MIVNWTNLKSFVTSRNLSVQWIEDSSKYYLKAFDGAFSLDCELSKNPSDRTDIDDFEANFKANGNKPIGARPFADAYGFRARFKGISFTATAGQVSNLDYTLSEERWIDGVELIQNGSTIGDYVKFQIVHPTAGVLDEFGDSWFIDPFVGKQNPVIISYPSKIPAGLKIRLVYNSFGESNVWVAANLRLHKKT